MKKRKEFVSFCVTVGRGSGRTRKEKESEVDCVEDEIEHRQKESALITLLTISIY